MKRFIAFLLVILLIPTISWSLEFSITGEFSHRFRSYLRAGTNDLFGNVNAAQSSAGTGLTTIGLSGPWNLQVMPEVLSSKGGIGSFYEQKLVLYPVIKVNNAVKINTELSFQGNLNGPYTGGSNWANPPHYAGWVQLNSRTGDGFNAIAVPVLRAAWISAETPLGVFRIGRFPLGFGVGWSGFHFEDYRPSMVLMSVPYGPMGYFLGLVISDNGSYSDPYDSRNANRTQLAISSNPDRNESKVLDLLTGFRYRDATMDAGFVYRFMYWNKVHAVPWSTWTLRDDAIGSPIAAPLSNGTFYNSTSNGTPTSTASSTPLMSDVYFNLLVFYLKYSDGRKFINLEYGQEFIKSDRQGARPISGHPKAWFIEVGAVAGPSKVTLMNAYRSGHQRSGGLLDFSWTVGSRSVGTANNQVVVTQVSDQWNQFIVMEGAHAAMEPYNFLIGYYGTGNNSYDSSGYPTYLDYLGFAIRIDYAVASNLNIFGSYLWNYRQSNTGSWWGQYSGGIYPPVLSGSNVPDSDLGPEWNLGMDWQLLENFLLSVKVGQWKPGNWFKYAYSDLSTTATVTDPISGNDVFVNPARDIDPIFGVNATITVNF